MQKRCGATYDGAVCDLGEGHTGPHMARVQWARSHDAEELLCVRLKPAPAPVYFNSGEATPGAMENFRELMEALEGWWFDELSASSAAYQRLVEATRAVWGAGDVSGCPDKLDGLRCARGKGHAGPHAAPEPYKPYATNEKCPHCGCTWRIYLDDVRKCLDCRNSVPDDEVAQEEQPR